MSVRLDRFSLAVILLLAGCRSLLGLDPPVLGHDAASADTGGSGSGSGDAAPDAPRYHATAVRFDPAADDYLYTGKLGTNDGTKGTLSMWLHFNGSDGQKQILAAAVVALPGGVTRESNNRFTFTLNNCSGPLAVTMQSDATYTTASGWVHLLAAWDVTQNLAQLYVDDVAHVSNAATADYTICYSADQWRIGGLSSGQLDADVADMFASLGTFIDLRVDANRRLFIDPTGKPVDLGTNCSAIVAATGAVTTGCFTGPVAMWNKNKGTGGGFDLGGAVLAAAPTSPSD